MVDQEVPTSSSNWAQFGAGLLKCLPWAKITAPMVPVIWIIWLLGDSFYKLHIFNIKNCQYYAFPTPKAWWTWLITSLACIAVYLGLSVYHMWKNPNRIQ